VASNPRSLALAVRYARALAAIGDTTAARVLLLLDALSPDRAAPTLLDGQAVAVRTSDAFLATFLSIELRRRVRPVVSTRRRSWGCTAATRLSRPRWRRLSTTQHA
jgi:hypothetical protein